MRRRVLAILIAASFVTGCYTGDSSTLSSTGTLVDSTPVVFALADGAPAHGPTNRVRICVAPEYRFSRVGLSTPMLVRGDESAIVLRVFVVLAEGPRRRLEPAGYQSCGRRAWGLAYSEVVPEVAGVRAKGIEVSSNGPVQIDSVIWWSGDPRKLPVLP
jgi:hypothetical protein